MTASFPTNLSGVLRFPCKVHSSINTWHWFIWKHTGLSICKIMKELTLIITFSFTENGYCTPLCIPSSAVISPFSWRQFNRLVHFIVINISLTILSTKFCSCSMTSYKFSYYQHANVSFQNPFSIIIVDTHSMCCSWCRNS